MTPDPTGAWAGQEVLVISPVPTHPATLGNRVRILEACRVMHAQGARLTLLHYPTDEEWRARLPLADHAAMRGFFADVLLVPPTRPPHTAAWPGPDHGIDEWWDPAIGQMLDWLCTVRRFDAVVVNYTWLSRALDHVPRGTLRILDTHDRFAGRRELLAAHGIAPEYFHTTVAEEAKAMARADLVWAIKGEEAQHFRALGAREVITVPHGEVPARPRRMAQGWRDGTPVLRLGVAGGRNRINAENLRAFLAAAEPVLRRTLLPVEIVVAGSLCDMVPDLARSWVRLLGTVENMDTLYDSVDAVLAPLAFSTGLKIKVGEALARGKALISHVHAFEGYVPGHAFHACADFPAMVRAIEAVARDPSLLDVLEQASADSAARTRIRMERAIAHSGRRAREKRRSVLIVAKAAQLRPGELAFDHVRDAAVALGGGGPVTFHLDGAAEDADLDCLRVLKRHGAVRMGVPLTDSLVGQDAVLFATLPATLPAALPTMGFAHLDLLAQSQDTRRLPAVARRFPRFHLLQNAPGAFGARLLAASGPGAHMVLSPLLTRGQDAALVRALVSAPEDGVAILAERGGDAALHPVIAFLANVLRLRPMIFSADGASPAMPLDGPMALPANVLRTAPAARFFVPGTHREGRPRFVVEIGASPAFAAAREILFHARIPMARLFDPDAETEAALRPEAFTRSRGVMAALLTLDHLARIDDRFRAELNGEAGVDTAGQAGWAAVLEALAAPEESPSA